MSNETVPHDESRLAYFPVSFFFTVMGLTGLAIAWQKAHHVSGMPSLVWQTIALAASAVFVGLLAIYGLKELRYPQAVMNEWKHPVRVNFFPTISICLLLLGIVWRETVPSMAYTLWVAGASIHLAFTLAILSSWIHHTHYDIKHANPAWFIPVVGNLFVPICVLALLLGSNVLRFLKSGFFLSAWAYSFPLAAMTIATFAMLHRSGVVAFNGVGLAMLAIVSLVVLVLIAKTLGAIGRRAICIPE